MHLRVPTPKGSIEVECDEKNAPCAVRCLQYQILKHSWQDADFKRDSACLKLIGSKFTPSLGSEKMRKITRGDVAFNSSNELLFWIGKDGGLYTILGTFDQSKYSFASPDTLDY